MGWSFTCDASFGRKQQIQQILSPAFWASEYTPLKSMVRGSRVWTLLSNKSTGKKSISLTLVKGGGRGMGYGYKGLDETAHPYYYDCPLALLDQADPIDSEGANEWRAKVRKWHEEQAARPEPETGRLFSYCDEQYRWHSPAGPRRGWYASRLTDGQLFRFSVRNLQGVRYVQ